MVNNWENSVKLNEIIKPDSTDNNLNEKIESTKNDIETGKEILEKQYIRLFEKYYPELNKKPLSNYYKFSISQETLKQDKVLNADELVIVLDKARTKELESMLKTITKNPYIQPIKNYQRQLFTAKKEVDNFYEDNKITKEEIYKLPDNKKDEIKKLISYQDLQLNTIQVMNKYYEQNILTNYPTLELKDITLGEKEELSKAIDYYGNTLSITKLMEKTRENVISKYSYNEQKIGMEFINKLDNNTFTKEDLKAIENDYRKKEIYETISDPAMRKLFMQEVETNGFTEQFSEQSEKQTQPLLSFLAKRINIYDNLLKATEDNKKRELNQNKKTDKSTNKKGQKQKQNSTRGI